MPHRFENWRSHCLTVKISMYQANKSAVSHHTGCYFISQVHKKEEATPREFVCVSILASSSCQNSVDGHTNCQLTWLWWLPDWFLWTTFETDTWQMSHRFEKCLQEQSLLKLWLWIKRLHSLSLVVRVTFRCVVIPCKRQIKLTINVVMHLAKTFRSYTGFYFSSAPHLGQSWQWHYCE